MMDVFTRRRTLYLRSSGDGNTDELSIDTGSMINRSLKKIENKILINHQFYLREFHVKFSPFHFVVSVNNDFLYQV
jgi:hypothetical protein